MILGLVGALFTLLGTWQTSQAATLFVVSNEGNMGSPLASSRYDVDVEISTPGEYRLQSDSGEMILLVYDVRPLDAYADIQISEEAQTALLQYGGSITAADGVVVTGQSDIPDLPVRIYLFSTPLPDGTGVHQFGILEEQITNPELPTGSRTECFAKVNETAANAIAALQRSLEALVPISKICKKFRLATLAAFDDTHARCVEKYLPLSPTVYVICTASAHARIVLALDSYSCPTIKNSGTQALKDMHDKAIAAHLAGLASCFLRPLP